jgi:hypothetical protein
MKNDDEGDGHEPSKAMPMRYYGDPLELLIARESATCKGCEHEEVVFGVVFCLKKKKHGRRCKHYVERTR